MRLLAMMLVLLMAFVGLNFYYQSKINEVQQDYDKKVERLKEIEEKLLLKEKKLNEISELKEAVEKDKEALEIGYISLQGENQKMAVEKIELEEDMYTRPFSKTLCKTTGNVQCFN